MRRVLTGDAVPLQIEEVHALIALIEKEGVANPHLAEAYEKLCHRLTESLDTQVKRIIALTRVG